jgi:Cys-tRNA(Pro)/Cys-tRNA(Cys) deacylase
MAKSTRATQALERAGVGFSLHAYEADRAEPTYGESVAAALGVDPDRVFKTLVAIVDGAPVVGIVPVSGHLSLKKLARAAGGKHATMADPADAERLTGYVVGGISPLGQRRRLSTYVDETATIHGTVFVSAGQRGLQVELAPEHLLTVVGGRAVDLAD